MSQPRLSPPNARANFARCLVVLAAGLLALLALAQTARAATGEIAILATNDPPIPTGSPAEYTINFTCSNVGHTDCGAEPVIRIPLDLTSSKPETPPMSGWKYDVASPIPGLIAEAKVEGGEYVIKLDPTKLHPGDSDTIQLNVTPPNGITPDETAWSLQPEFETTELPVTVAPDPALGEAEATAKLAISKNTNDGGAVYVSGNKVIFNITASCNPGNPTGSLYLTHGQLVDQLPAGLEFESATPAPSSAPAIGASGPIVWDYPTAKDLPPGCAPGAEGAGSYQVIAKIPAGTPQDTVFTNTATLGGTPIGAPAETLETSAGKQLTAIEFSPTSPGVFLGKSAQGPLDIPGAGFLGTYAGNWIKPINSAPSLSPGSVEGRYRVTITYPASRAFETDLADPVPCLANQEGVRYSSLATAGPIAGPGSIPLCAEPAFHPTVVRVESASLAAAVGEGWVPEAITTSGAAVPLALGSGGGGARYFVVNEAIVGEVAAIELPRSPSLTDRSMNMDVFGYADPSVPPGSDLHDVAVATAYPTTGSEPPVTGSEDASLFIEPTQLQLGVSKSFGPLRTGPGGSSLAVTMNLAGSITIPPGLTLPGPIVLTDLLPKDIKWSNPVASGSFNLQKGLSGGGTTITGTVEQIANFEGSGRDLIRVEFDPADFAEEGFYMISPPSGFFELSLPNQTRTYNNSAQLFAAGIGRETPAACGAAKGSSPAEFHSSDPLDLDGDGVIEENYCEASASIATPGIGGPSFGLEKTVQGDLDPLEKGALETGNAKPGGSGVYTLTWGNTGGKNLEGAVIYDILPHLGDTGVGGLEANAPRGSEFTTVFTGVVSLPPEVTAEYSTSTNPCRPEVFAENPGCLEDWTPAPPADLGAVKALRFKSAQTYLPGESFSVQLGIALPKGEVNTVAWNNAASDAVFNGTPLKPAEPPKVGITAKVTPVEPTVSTAVSSPAVTPGTAVFDRIQIGNTNAYDGKLEWKLLGPLPAAGNGSCDGLAWSGAATVGSGEIATEADGGYQTPASTLTATGCYGYEVTLSGPGFTKPVTSPAGTPGEIVLVKEPPPPSPPPTSPPSPDEHARLSIVKRVNQAQAQLGQPLTYTLEVHNKGPGKAEGVTLTDKPVTSMAFVSATPSQGRCGHSFPLDCRLGTLAAGRKATVKVIAKPLVAGKVVNTAKVGSTDPAVRGVKDAAASRVRIPLRLSKQASRGVVRAGSRFGYRIEVENPTATTARNAKVCDRPPAGIAYLSSSPSGKLSDGRYCWTIAALAAHRSKSISIVAKALRGARGKLVNTAVLSGPDLVGRQASAAISVRPSPTAGGGVTG